MGKRVIFIIIGIISIIGLSACGSDDGEYTIGASQLVEHPSLDSAYDGFKDALKNEGLDVDYDFQSAQNDVSNVSTISENFVSDDVDLVFANSTPSAEGAKQATDDIPIVFTSVTDAVIAGLVDSNEEPGENVTGVTDMHPDQITETVDFIDSNFPDMSIGLIYNSGEENSVAQIDIVEEAVEDTGLDMTERTVSSSSEVQEAASSLVDEADVFYIINDNTVVSAIDSVVGVAEDNEMPLFAGEPDSLEKGAFLSYGFDFYDIGYRSGEMAEEILTGDKEAGDLEVEFPPDIELYINKDAAESQGVEWDDDWDDEANMVEPEE